MKQNSPAHMKAMRLRKALSAAQRKLDISEKLIDDLRQDPGTIVNSGIFEKIKMKD
jgi:hypothetical protein